MSPAAEATGLKVFGKMIGKHRVPPIRIGADPYFLASQVLTTYLSALPPSEATAASLVTSVPSSKETVTS
jgi:hypothetical protein